PVAAAPAIPGPPSLLQGHGRRTYAHRADRLRRAFEPVRGGRDRREVAETRGRADLALRIERGVAEFLQERRDSRAIVTKPAREHAAIDRAGHAPPTVDVFGRFVEREPAHQRGAQPIDV